MIYDRDLRQERVKFIKNLCNVKKWLNILLKSCGDKMPIFLKHIRAFFNIMQERVKYLYMHYIYI